MPIQGKASLQCHHRLRAHSRSIHIDAGMEANYISSLKTQYIWTIVMAGTQISSTIWTNIPDNWIICSQNLLSWIPCSGWQTHWHGQHAPQVQWYLHVQVKGRRWKAHCGVIAGGVTTGRVVMVDWHSEGFLVLEWWLRSRASSKVPTGRVKTSEARVGGEGTEHTPMVCSGAGVTEGDGSSAGQVESVGGVTGEGGVGRVWGICTSTVFFGTGTTEGGLGKTGEGGVLKGSSAGDEGDECAAAKLDGIFGFFKGPSPGGTGDGVSCPRAARTLLVSAWRQAIGSCWGSSSSVTSWNPAVSSRFMAAHWTVRLSPGTSTGTSSTKTTRCRVSTGGPSSATSSSISMSIPTSSQSDASACVVEDAMVVVSGTGLFRAKLLRGWDILEGRLDLLFPIGHISKWSREAGRDFMHGLRLGPPNSELRSQPPPSRVTICPCQCQAASPTALCLRRR